MSSVSRTAPYLIPNAVVVMLLIGTLFGLGLLGSSQPASAQSLPGPAAPLAASSSESVSSLVSSVTDNTEYNWSYNFTSAPTLAVGDFFNLSAGELLSVNPTTFSYSEAGFGVVIAGTGTSVTVAPTISLQNHTSFTGTATLPTSGDVGLKMAWAHGWWWTFSYIVGATTTPIVGPHGWENGTYDLNVSVAEGYYSLPTFGVYIGPVLNLAERGASLPLTLPALTIPSVFWLTVAGSPVVPASGQIFAVSGTAGIIGMSGKIQEPALAIDSLAVPGTGPVTANDTTLWGKATSTFVVYNRVGAYTNDTEFSGNVTTGIALTATIPTVSLASGQLAALNVSLPITGSLVMTVGIGSINFAGTTYTVPEFGEWNAGVLSVWIDYSPLSAGTYTIALVHESGSTWNVTFATGSSVGSTTIPGTISLTGGSSSTGSFNLGVSAAWGVNDRAPSSDGVFTTQPLASFTGNSTVFNATSTWLMQPSGGSWVTPGYGFAWQFHPAVNVALGEKQDGSLTSGQVMVTGTPWGPYTSALPNGTLMWTPAPEVTLVAVPHTVGGGGIVAFTAYVNLTGKATGAASPGTPTSTLSGGSFSAVTGVTGSPGVYTFTWTSPVVTSIQTATISLTATLPAGAGSGKGEATITVDLPFTLDVAAYVNGSSHIATTNGGTVDLTIYVNSSGAVSGGPTSPVTGVTITPSDNLTTNAGTFGTVSSKSAGVYTFTYTAPTGSKATLVAIQISASAAGYATFPSLPNPILVTVTPPALPQLVLSEISLGSTSTYTSGQSVTFSVTVTSGGSDVSGATVTFDITPTIPGVTLTSTTNAQGVASITFTAPSVTSAQSYTLSATAAKSSYASGTSTSTAFDVQPSSSTTTPSSSSSGLSSLELYGIIGVVVVLVIVVLAVLMMRKKKTPPAEQPSDMPPEYAQGPPPGA